jgi:hypothetical protein
MGQQSNRIPAHGIPGLLDPGSGLFTPMGRPILTPEPQDNQDSVETPATVVSGKFVINLTITISSSIPTTETIACDAEALVFDSLSDIVDTAGIAATRSGSTATCTVTIPYSWSLTSTTDSVLITYTISSPPDPFSSSTALPRRFTNHAIAKITAPATGTTTTYNVSQTI